MRKNYNFAQDKRNCDSMEGRGNCSKDKGNKRSKFKTFVKAIGCAIVLSEIEKLLKGK